ncbi:MAG: FG-GAP-like repeat-containing protein [Acidobacteriota bacterium]
MSFHPSSLVGRELLRGLVFATLLALVAPSACADLPSVPTFQWSWDLEVVFEGPFPVNPTLVAQLTDDDGDGLVTTADVPDVVVVTWMLGSHPRGTLRAFDGATGEEHWNVDSPELIASAAGSLLAAADLDDDGVVELVVTDRAELHVFENDGSHAFSRSWPRELIPIGTDENGINLGVADLNQDGVPEIFAQDMVVSVDGSLSWTGWVDRPHEWTDGYSHAVDIDPTSPGLELINGRTIYSATGAILHRNEDLAKGHVAIADFTGDGEPEIAMVFPETTIALLEPNLDELGPPYLAISDNHGATAADIDGDGIHELLVPKTTELLALEWDGTGLALKWTTPVRDGSCCARVSAYDFDGDGAAEIVYRDMIEWFIFCGEDGTPLHRERLTHYTGAERLVVADIDADEVAEIIVTGAQGGDWDGEMRAYEVAGAVTPRAIWNQDGSHGTNVNDDGTLPRIETPPWRAEGAWLTQLPATPNRPLAPFGGGEVEDVDPCVRGVEIRWEALDVANPEQPVTYEVHRSDAGTGCEDASSWTLLASDLTETRWIDLEPEPGRRHAYWVVAIAGVGGCPPPQELCVEGIDAVPPPLPDGVYATLRARNEGERVTFTWDAARALLPDEAYHLLKARGVPMGFAQANPDDDTSRSFTETDTSSPLQFFDLRVESCSVLSADEYPPDL